MASDERRRTKRIPAQLEVNIVHDDDYIISLSKDISVDGMFIATTNPPPVGSIQTLTFSIGELREVSVKAMVMWTNQKENVADHGMGVQFIDASDELREAILHSVNRVAVFDTEEDGPTN
ncbi:MAG: PilZ domain-containing protein [Desulfobulbaceae bacterium]|nr:PilZ domain-containing protein [Desulfobulbaceae bacterium]